MRLLDSSSSSEEETKVEPEVEIEESSSNSSLDSVELKQKEDILMIKQAIAKAMKKRFQKKKEEEPATGL